MNILPIQKFRINPRVYHTGLRSFSKVFSQNDHWAKHVQNKYLLKSSLPCHNLSRNFWETFPYLTRNLYATDGFNTDDCQLVYRNKIFNYAFYGQLISQSVILVQLCFELNVLFQTYILKNVVPTIEYFGTIPIVYNFWSFLILCVMTYQNLIIYHVTRIMVLRIYHKPDTDEHIVISLSVNPFKTRKLLCKKGDVENLHVENYKAFFGNFRCCGHKLFINPHSFRNMSEYIHFSRHDDEE